MQLCKRALCYVKSKSVNEYDVMREFNKITIGFFDCDKFQYRANVRIFLISYINAHFKFIKSLNFYFKL